MNQEEFEQVFETLIAKSREVLINKAREYANDGDRLHNFKVASAFQGSSPEQALWGMATKHFVSLSDMIRSDEFYPEETWDEKLGDALNYLILLRAQVYETDDERSFSESDDLTEVVSPPATIIHHLPRHQAPIQHTIHIHNPEAPGE